MKSDGDDKIFVSDNWVDLHSTVSARDTRAELRVRHDRPSADLHDLFNLF